MYNNYNLEPSRTVGTVLIVILTVLLGSRWNRDAPYSKIGTHGHKPSKSSNDPQESWRSHWLGQTEASRSCEVRQTFLGPILLCTNLRLRPRSPTCPGVCASDETARPTIALRKGSVAKGSTPRTWLREFRFRAKSLGPSSSLNPKP